MRRLLNRIESAIVRSYDFISNVRYYYFERRLRLDKAIDMARNTLP